MMYVLQVLTGRETEICGKLRRAGNISLLPAGAPADPPRRALAGAAVHAVPIVPVYPG